MKKYFIKIAFITLILFTGSVLYSQNREIDSLWGVYKNKSKVDTNRLKAINKISSILSSLNPDTALIVANEQLIFARKVNSKKYEACALNNIGDSYNLLDNYSSALINYIESAKIFEEISDYKYAGISYKNIETVYFKQANYPKALEYALKSLTLFEKIAFKSGVSAINVGISNIYVKLSNYTKALHYCNNALKGAQELNDKYNLSVCYTSRGNIYNGMPNHKLALEDYFKSLTIKEEIGDERGIAKCFNNIGGIYLSDGDIDKALIYLKKALSIAIKNENTLSIASAQNNIGVAYIRLKKYNLAISYLDSAILLSEKIGDLDGLSNGYQDLSSAYNKNGNFKEAYNNYVNFKAINDSIFNIENSKQLSDLKTTFEVEKKEAELKAKAQAQAIISLKEQQQQKLITYIIIGILILVMIFAIFMFNRFKVTQKQKQIIEFKENETQKQNIIITEQKYLVEEKHKEITDSINYAERIQRSFLASEELLSQNLKDYFVFFQPKDVVSGDFYWATKLTNENFALVTADSTGHGVPGAIMSLLNITSIESSIKDGNESPADILNATRKTIIERLKKDGSVEGGKDGMDCSIISFDFKNSKFTYSAANNPVWVVRENHLIELAPDKMPVGKHDKDQISFASHEFSLQKGDVIYTLTDGLPDQFGGPNGKKFMYKKLKEFLVSISNLSMTEQKQQLKNAFVNWKGNLEQVDDVCIIGIKI